MPFKDPQEYREYMRRYRQQCKPTSKPEAAPEAMPENADPEHVRRLAQAVGMAVATPRGRGTLLHASTDGAWAVVGGAGFAFHPAQVGLW